MHMLSPDGISHSFDSRANGYARGDAIAGIVLKPLSAAIADGDTIRAVVRSTATNQDGRTPGITVPSSEAQAALIRTAYDAAGLSYDQTAYFEAHGTGTSVGVRPVSEYSHTELSVYRTPLNSRQLPIHLAKATGCRQKISRLAVLRPILATQKVLLALRVSLKRFWHWRMA